GALGQRVEVVDLVGADAAGLAIGPVAAAIGHSAFQVLDRGVVPARVQRAATQRSAQAHVVVVGLQVGVASVLATKLGLVAIVTTPTQLAVTVLAVGQRQLHDFEVIGTVDGPAGD